MTMTYDPEANAAYVYVVDQIRDGEVASSRVAHIELEGASIVCDFDVEGRLLGVEILGARNVLRQETLDKSDHLA